MFLSTYPGDPFFTATAEAGFAIVAMQAPAPQVKPEAAGLFQSPSQDQSLS
jgi:hypothetical protein